MLETNVVFRNKQNQIIDTATYEPKEFFQAWSDGIICRDIAVTADGVDTEEMVKGLFENLEENLASIGLIIKDLLDQLTRNNQKVFLPFSIFSLFEQYEGDVLRIPKKRKPTVVTDKDFPKLNPSRIEYDYPSTFICDTKVPLHIDNDSSVITTIERILRNAISLLIRLNDIATQLIETSSTSFTSSILTLSTFHNLRNRVFEYGLPVSSFLTSAEVIAASDLWEDSYYLTTNTEQGGFNLRIFDTDVIFAGSKHDLFSSMPANKIVACTVPEKLGVFAPVYYPNFIKINPYSTQILSSKDFGIFLIIYSAMAVINRKGVYTCLAKSVEP